MLGFAFHHVAADGPSIRQFTDLFAETVCRGAKLDSETNGEKALYQGKENDQLY